MTNSVTRPGKRERLIGSAGDLMYRQGVQRTTLAQIAAHADVPAGNVYYYFKTFDDLVEAVIDDRQTTIRDTLAKLDRRRSPKAKLKGLAEEWTDSADLVAVNGCPIGSLASELNKSHDQPAERAADLLRTVLDFMELQFRELGRRDAAALSVTMMSRIQGAALLANTFGDPALLKAEVRRIERWLDELS
ncbi:TetR/AcrR family transcriptional regulator [Jiangella ureilytica]|uniref:TetR/AcrR family transcriptional regulator n=1 Tax=Jiangella ureilytica TaxID=2530374 RepID=A0A4R4RES7_9ACTN|nr:TetR/AcrR family transcriptional regulator [Jiangella ureilytica]TDC47720.1 TetR/AcrR family transcriptional regulator [Jiangella ureilytica]